VIVGCPKDRRLRERSLRSLQIAYAYAYAYAYALWILALRANMMRA
jgi:hypothetical protein